MEYSTNQVKAPATFVPDIVMLVEDAASVASLCYTCACACWLSVCTCIFTYFSRLPFELTFVLFWHASNFALANMVDIEEKPAAACKLDTVSTALYFFNCVLNSFSIMFRIESIDCCSNFLFKLLII